MYNKLEQIELDIQSELRNLDWDAQKESFQNDLDYKPEKKLIVLEIEGKTITYNLGEYIFDYSRKVDFLESVEGGESMSQLFNGYFNLIHKLIDRLDSIPDRIAHYSKFEERLVSLLEENLQGVGTEFHVDKYQFILSAKEAYHKRFGMLKMYDELFTVVRIDAVHRNYAVYKWNGTQADLFRYTHLAMELGLIDNDRPAIGDFIRKHVVCKSRTTGEYVPIPFSELKGTFYNQDRSKPKSKFINKLIKAIRDKYPE